MGQSEQLAQRTFAEETERTTGGAIGWQDPPEIRLDKVTSDGFLVIRRPRGLAHLPQPWPEAQAHDEVMLELKLAGNHLDREAVERAVLRRQARQLQRVRELDASWRGHEPLWLVAPHLPRWLHEVYAPVRGAPGCYWVEPQWQRFLWIAANELPLVDALIPFLLARSGQKLDEFCLWVAPRRPFGWVLTMLECLPMSTLTQEELIWRFSKTDDPVVEARRQRILDFLLETSPQKKQQLMAEGRLTEARAALRRVLVGRQLAPSQDDDARIEACTDLATLERWLDRAITATSVLDALR
jgi:hypothetical protein